MWYWLWVKLFSTYFPHYTVLLSVIIILHSVISEWWSESTAVNCMFQMSTSGCKKIKFFNRNYYVQKECRRDVENSRRIKKIGTSSSKPQESHRNEYGGTQSGRALWTGDWRRSKTGDRRTVNKSLLIPTGGCIDLECAIIHFPLNYNMDVYILCVSSASLLIVGFVDFWVEDGIFSPLNYSSFHHYYQ